MSDTTTCPHCQREYAARMKHCPFCGGEPPRVQPRGLVLPCPRCARPLTQEQFRGSEIDSCPEHGVWLDRPEFDHHTSERDTFGDEAIPRDYQQPPLPGDRGYIPCPRCLELMKRENFRAISNVLIDVCPLHGVWLDAGELEQIRRFVASGGLSRSQDKQIRRNAEEVARVARECTSLNEQARMLHRFNIMRVFWQGKL